MTRYLFRADYDGVQYDDDVGEVFATLSEAIAHAEIVAEELRRNSTKSIIVSVLERFTIRLTISGVGKICRALARREVGEATADCRPQAFD